MTFADYFLDLFEKYTGDNEQEVFKAQRAKGFFHSALPTPENFMVGIASVAEVQVCRKALRGHIHMAHLLAVENDSEDEGSVLLKLRTSTGASKGSVYYHRVPAGSVADRWCRVETEQSRFSPTPDVGMQAPSSSTARTRWARTRSRIAGNRL